MKGHQVHVASGRTGKHAKTYLAKCECGWTGHTRSTDALARQEHDDHVLTILETEG